MVGVVIALAVLLLAFVYLVGVCNGLVNLRKGVNVTWANINVLLRQRHDELPTLVDACKRYRQFEQETLEKVVRAGGVAGFLPALTALTLLISRT